MYTQLGLIVTQHDYLGSCMEYVHLILERNGFMNYEPIYGNQFIIHNNDPLTVGRVPLFITPKVNFHLMH